MEKRKQLLAYLTDQLSKSEISALESELQADENLREECALLKEAILGVKLAKVRKELNDYHLNIKEESLRQSREQNVVAQSPSSESIPVEITASEPVEEKSSKHGLMQRIFIGAGFFAAGLFTLGAIYLGFNAIFAGDESNVHRDLYEQYYETDPGTETELPALDEVEFTAAMVDYKAGDYAAAGEEFVKLNTAAPSDLLKYYIGQSLLANGDAQEAIEYFSKVSDSSEYREKAIWYQALAYLSLNYKQECKQFLEEEKDRLSNEAILADVDALLKEME